MLDHISVQAYDVDRAVAFYLEVFSALGFREAMRYSTDTGPVVGIAGPDGFPHFWLGPATDDARQETHVAFAAPDRPAVDRVYAAAMGIGAEILHAPRVWPEYHPSYYGVFIRDPDGNNVEAVSHG